MDLFAVSFVVDMESHNDRSFCLFNEADSYTKLQFIIFAFFS